METKPKALKMANPESHLEPRVASLETNMVNLVRTVEEQGDNTNRAISRLTNAVDDLRGFVAGQGKVNWPLIVSTISLLVVTMGAVGGAVFTINKLMSDHSADKLAQETRHSRELANINHENTAHALDQHVHSPGHSGSSERLTALEKQMEEIETQFKSIDQTTNLMHQQQERFIQMLWEKTNGTTLPAQDYWPQHGRTLDQ